LKVKHHFVTPGCAWANGSVERANREALRVYRTLLAEAQLPYQRPKKTWPRANMATYPHRGSPRQFLGDVHDFFNSLFFTYLGVHDFLILYFSRNVIELGNISL
jgi:hypothetical protein